MKPGSSVHCIHTYIWRLNSSWSWLGQGTVAVPARSTYAAQPICLSIVDALRCPAMDRTDGRTGSAGHTRTATPRKTSRKSQLSVHCARGYVRRCGGVAAPAALLCCCSCYGTCPWVRASVRTHATSICPTRRLIEDRCSVPLTVGLYDKLTT